MGKHGTWHMIVVDRDSKQYAVIDPPTDEKAWDRKVCLAKEKGRDIHCFSHDMVDMPGLTRWAKQHELTQTNISDILSTS